MLARNMVSMSALSLYRSGLQFLMNIVLARFVAPADYGLVVFTAPFLFFLALMTDLGLSSAVVRSEALDGRQIAAAFTVTAGLGLAAALALGGAAFPIQALVHMRGLGPVMAAMSAVVLLSVSSSVPRALLERQLRYGRIAVVEAVSVLVAFVSAIAAAMLGAGVWALVLYNLLNQGLQMASFAWAERRALRLEFHWGGLRPLLSFGGWVLATNTLSFFSRNSDNLLIGAVLGSAAVGIYGLGYQFMMIPLMALTWPSSSVLFATLSRARVDTSQVRRTVRAVFSATAALSFPAMAYLTFGLAYPVHAVLSQRWAGVAPIVSWLAPLGALQSITSYSGAMLMAAGLARRQFLLSFANAILTVLVFAVTVRLGLPVLVKSYVAVSGLLSLVMLAFAVRATPTTWQDVATGVGPGAAATAAGLLLAALSARLAVGEFQTWLVASAAFAVGVFAAYAAMHATIRRSLEVFLARAPDDLPEPQLP